MAEDFWAPVFERLLEDYAFLELVAVDSSENDLISLVKPNRALFARCARFIKKNRVLDKPALAREMLAYSRNDRALRQIILFTWVEKNPQTMKFPTLATDVESESKLLSGAFGSPAKVRILAQIDPRPAARPIYERVLSIISENVAIEDVKPAATEDSAGDEAARNNLAARIAELEKLLESFKVENRQLKKQVEQQRNELTAQSRRIEDFVGRLKKAEYTNQSLENESAGLRSRLAYAEEQLKKASVAVEIRPAVDDSEKLAAFEAEIEALRRAVDNREATIRRLDAEKGELTAKQAIESDKDRQIEGLRRRLTDLESMSQVGPRLAGQLISTHKEPCGQRSWLFMSISGRAIFVEGSLVSRTSLVCEEFAILQLNRENRPVAIESLEADARREICGCVEVCGSDLYLVADSQRYQVMVEIPETSIGLPVRAVWLPEFAERRAGIYRVEVLAQHDRPALVQKTADIRQLRAFFRVSRLNLARLGELLRQQGVEYEISADGQMTFLADYHEVLAPLRMHVKIYRSCKNAACQELAGGEALVREAAAGQTCDFCGCQLPSEAVSVAKTFSGQRVMIFGGDYVGSEYERVLSRYNLSVEWFSGFRSLGELKNGLGRPDLVVVIVRQISHTLLRELVAAVNRDSLPVLYSSRRGISGVLADLTDHFDSRQKNI
ncbi:MAG: hypothetical protein GQF41_1712 [Candidatus Rifleibacterium amylolyticum]|nr:MAG: hypothetical protein GQF41_1712 [Candidatus Rifleibacterium amylolyticum]